MLDNYDYFLQTDKEPKLDPPDEDFYDDAYDDHDEEWLDDPDIPCPDPEPDPLAAEYLGIAYDILQEYQKAYSYGIIGVMRDRVQVEIKNFYKFVPNKTLWKLYRRNSDVPYEVRYYFDPDNYLLALLDEEEVHQWFTPEEIELAKDR